VRSANNGAGALGWVAGISIGAIYHLMTRLWHTEMWSESLVNVHFWTATIGTVIYVVAMWVSGIMQGLMWRAYDEYGTLAYTFVESVAAMHPYYAMRAVGEMMEQCGGDDSDKPFATVARFSELGTEIYDLAIRPFVQAMTNQATAQLMAHTSPMRVQRWLQSDRNPAMQPVKALAEQVRANRNAAADDNPFRQLERFNANLVTQWWDGVRDLQNAMIEWNFHLLWAAPPVQAMGERLAVTVAQSEPREDLRTLTQVQDALDRIELGEFADGVIRMLIFLANSMRFGAQAGNVDFRIYSHAGGPVFGKLADLSGKRLAVWPGGAAERLAAGIDPLPKLLPVASIEEALRAVAAGDADATIMEQTYARYVMAQQAIGGVAEPVAILSDGSGNILRIA